jgi:3-methylfumaryl-CoA hydratase
MTPLLPADASTSDAASPLDIAHLRTWEGRCQERHDTAHVGPARRMAATVGLPADMFEDGTPLPPLWHWLYFLEAAPAAVLGRDGHPARGGFLPPVPLANRMWAGGQVEFLASIPLGAPMERASTVQSVQHKQGRSGDLVFVTVLHEVAVGGQPCIRETHDIVYKNASPAPSAAPAGGAASAADELPLAASEHWTPDSVQLFRYSALTFNGHRIHYDADYCRNVEGYPNLVVHGPLTATLLAGLAQRTADRPVRCFVYRGLHAMTLGQSTELRARWAPPAEGGIEASTASLQLESRLDSGVVSMSAVASF